MRLTTRRLLPAAGLLALLVSASSVPAQAPATFDDPILERMRKDIFFLASPECEGRGVDTKGIEKAADYVADAFKAAGLKPGGKNGSYFQPFTLTISAKLGSAKLSFTGPDGKDRELKANTEANPLGFSPTAKAAGGLVFVGYGITSKELKYDDYAGVNAEGKIVVVLRKTPRPDKTKDDRFDTTVANGDDSPHAALAAKIENAVAHKAAGIIFVNDVVSAGKADTLYPYGVHATGTEAAPIPVFHLKRKALDDLLTAGPWKPLADIEQAIDKDLTPRSFDLTGWKADADVTVNRTEYKVKNVVGVAEGHGPLADETIVLGAHYDHVGYGNFGSLGGADARGKIHLGADDNASGTTGLMELARRYGAMKNREGRRVVFVAFTAEERGLYGSVHYCKQPVFPLEKTAAMINMDMIGRSKSVPSDWLGIAPMKDRLVVYGVGSGDTFNGLVDTAVAKHDFKASKQQAGTGPSDHDSFYRKKVPVLFLYTGTHNEYHRPTDVPEKINVPAMKKVADLVEDLTNSLATVPTPPKYQVTRDPWIDPTESRAASTPRPMGPRLGVRPDYNYEGDGVLLEGVTPGGAAEKGGLKDGDVIIEIGGKPTKTVGAYMTAMSAAKAGEPLEVVVLRKGQKMTLKVTPQ